jgi:hypothetical protein
MLNELQGSVLSFINLETLRAHQRFHNGDNVQAQINVAAAYAYALYTDLVTSGRSLPFSTMMPQNRGLSPTDPAFFRHLHALQGFVTLVNPLLCEPPGDDSPLTDTLKSE